MRSASSTRSWLRRGPVKSATARCGRQRWTTWSGYGQGSAALTPSEELREARATLLGASLEPAALRQRLSDAADTWFNARLAEEDGGAVVAVGGYGRRELTPGSDLDVVLLHDNLRSVKEVADGLWYPIWDAGVSLDHSVRTVDEAAAVAREDLKAMLGLLDARHVAGDADLTARLREQALGAWRRDAKKRLPELVAAVRERAERSGELAFLLEPDLKECRGGLRDVHAMTAAAATWVTDAPSERVHAAASRLLDVRVALHQRALDQQAKRPSDRLLLQEQGPGAKALGLADPDDLMREVYEAARIIAFAGDLTWRRVEAALRPPRRSRPGLFRSAVPTRRPLADGVVEQDGEVVLARDAEPATDPVLLLRVAAAAAQSDLPIAPHTLERLSDAPAMPEPWPAAARDELVALLGAGPAVVHVVEALDQAQLFSRLLPEWDKVRCKPQRNAVHPFPVARHLVDAVAEAGSPTRRGSRPDLLLLGALLHDMGKGYPGDHTEAGVEIVPVIGQRLGLDPHDIGVLMALVHHHLLLPDTATRRDIDDPATVALVTDAVRDRATLELLHALTEADALATGPAAWGDWKARLVEALVARAAGALDGEEPPQPELLDEAQQELATRGELAMEVHGERVTLAAPDRPGLLWRWAGVLSLHRLATPPPH